ncbi:uncharacterized protein C8R40DRAFT_1108422 [Lentinula edodes]|uniref:uncharacterized protein n=1 Tax=Lentinula edodes TaxID=5353 RepID=UPI001E8E6A84|nr:uncharacterized protein C8R40DRAFT_1108422 [Lentinula edodes]KAH7874356.1 hypothetical protein C8R40DRAFT_1108422 [Lentinula edodes]
MKKDVDKPPKYLYDGRFVNAFLSNVFQINESRSSHRHNPESELKGPPKHIPLTLPPLHQQRISVHPRQVTLPPMTQFMQMTFADRYYNDPNHLPPAFSLPSLGPGRRGQNSAGDIVSSDSEEANIIPQPRLLPPKFRPDHRIWNLLRVANYYLPDDLHYAIVTGQHPQVISDLIVKLEADYRQRKTHPSSCYELTVLCSDPLHPIWNLLLLTDYDLPDEVRDAINECRPLPQIREICERLLRVWMEKPRM